ncbi:MAG: diacylglycerol/lipid kinase family protein [Bacillota bacterium]
MKAIALINAAAGSEGSDQSTRQQEQVHSALAAVGVDATVQSVDAKHLAIATRDALARRPDLIIAGGGDGTVSTIASVLANTDIPLGVLPLGTLNHFAKDLNLPLDLEAATKAIATGRTRPIDIGQVNHHYFINNSSIGIYPKMVRNRKQRQHQGQGKWPAMAAAAVQVFSRMPLYHVRLNRNGHEEDHTTPFIFVGNNRYEISPPDFGGRTSLDLGQLSLYIAKSTSRLATLGLLFHAALGRLEQSPQFDSYSLPELWIHTSRPEMDVALDGEVTRFPTPLHYQIRPGALRVITP